MQQSKLLLRKVFFFLLWAPCSATAFLVHGSFAKNSSWYRSGGAFYHQIESQYSGSIRSFSWSGSPLQSDIIEASYDLAKEILECPIGEPATLIGHSNGGNVIAYATSLIYFAITPESENDEIKQRLLKLVDEIIDDENILRSQQDLTDAVEYTQIKTIIRDAYIDLYQLGQARMKRSNEYLIKDIYMMGTPIHKHTFTVNMNVAEKVFNLYSEADYVQILVGDRIITPHPRVTNLHTQLVTDTGKVIRPCHHTIHHEIIAQWLLHLPTVVAEHPDSVERGDGTIIFSADKPPVYTPGT